MLGVVSGKRDGLSNQQGIAFGSKIFIAKTGGSDNQSHGPFHDYVYFHTGHQALVAAGAKAINESWGQFVQTLTEPATTVAETILESTATSPTLMKCKARTAPTPR